MNQNFSKPSIGQILREAFNYWKKTLSYHIIFSLIYFSILFFVSYHAANYFGIMEAYSSALEKIKISKEAYISEIQKISKTNNYRYFYWTFLATLSFLYPLNLGLFKIFRKIDLNGKISIHDLFAGYLGINFFIHIGFYLFWISIYNILLPTVFLAVVWVFVTLFCSPLMFFMNKRILESIKYTIKSYKFFFFEISIIIILAFIIKYAGILSIFGALLSLPIWNVFIYVLYKNIFVEQEKK